MLGGTVDTTRDMSTTAALGSEPDDFDAFELSPLPTLVLQSASDGPDGLGQIAHANSAAQALFDADRIAGADATIFDVVGSSAHAELRRVLTHSVGADTRPRMVLVTVSGAIDAGADCPKGDCSGRVFQMHLQRRFGSDLSVAHFTRVATAGVDRVVAEQQRFRSALMELSELAHTTADDNEFYQTLIERAVEVVPGAQGGSVQLNIEGTAVFRFVAAVGYDLEGLQRHELEQEHFFRDTWDPMAQIVRNFEADTRSPEITEWLETVGRLSEIVVNVSAPVLSEGFPVAFLSLDNFENGDAINDTSVEMTTVLSRLIGDLLRRRELEAAVRKEREAYRHLAMHDPLTGLANRRNIERTLTEMLDATRAAERPSAVLFVDVDDFKGVNDRMGHEVGDRLLIGIAEGLKKAVRLSDVVGRWGGDEFLVLPHRVESGEQVHLLAERILNHFSSPLDLGDGVSYRARLSVGVGWSKSSRIDMDELVRLADTALYEAKAGGKGVVRTLDADGGGGQAETENVPSSTPPQAAVTAYQASLAR